MFLKMGKSKGKPEQGADEEEAVLVKKVKNLEELAISKPQDLEELTAQLEQLPEKEGNLEEGKEETDALFSEPDKPAVESLEEPKEGGELGGKEEANKEEQGPEKGEEKVQEEGAKITLENAEQGKEEQSSEGDDDSLQNLFADDEEEVNPLAGLLKSLPEVTASELLNEAQEVSIIVREWRHR